MGAMYFGGFLIGTLSVGVLKTAVMILSIVLLGQVVLGRRGSARSGVSLIASEGYRRIGALLLVGLGSFVLSELTCATEIYVLYRPTAALRMVHSYASALGAALLVYATALALDRRALHYFDESKHCAFIGLCRGCPRREGRSCRLHGLFFWALAFLTVMAVPLLWIPVRDFVVDPAGVALSSTSLNAFFDEKLAPMLTRTLPHWSVESLKFTIPSAMSLAEFRVIPAASIALGVAAMALSFVRRWDYVAFALACLAAGPLAYAYLEAAIYQLLPHVYLGSLGHEIAELIGLLLLRSVLHEVLGNAPAAVAAR